MHPHALHVSACLCMYPHVQPVFRPSDPHPVAKLPGSNIRPVHMPSGLVSWIVANPTQHPHPSRCVRPAAPQYPSIPPSIVFVQSHTPPSTPIRESRFSVLFSCLTLWSPVPTSVPLSPWSPLRLDVSALTFPSYFSSGFLSILNFPSQVFFLTFSCIWVVVPLPFARRLSAPLSSSLSRPINFSVGSSSAAFLWLVPSSAVSHPDDFLPYSVLQPMPLGIVQ